MQPPAGTRRRRGPARPRPPQARRASSCRGAGVSVGSAVVVPKRAKHADAASSFLRPIVKAVPFDAVHVISMSPGAAGRPFPSTTHLCRHLGATARAGEMLALDDDPARTVPHPAEAGAHRRSAGLTHRFRQAAAGMKCACGCLCGHGLASVIWCGVPAWIFSTHEQATTFPCMA